MKNYNEKESTDRDRDSVGGWMGEEKEELYSRIILNVYSTLF